MDRIVHAVTPIAVIGAATALAALRIIDSSTAVTLITTAGSVGALAVGKSKSGS